MRLATGVRSRDKRACNRWLAARPTSTTNGPAGSIHDRYTGFVEPRDTGPRDFERIRERLFAYDIFPPPLMRFRLCPAARVAVGMTIVQWFGISAVSIEAAVRVVDAWDKQNGVGRSAGFRYVTLAGHPERGVESFEVRLDERERVQVIVEARSLAGSAITRFGQPIARAVQVGMTRAALRRLTHDR